MNIIVGARKCIINDLFIGQFLGRDCRFSSYILMIFLIRFYMFV